MRWLRVLRRWAEVALWWVFGRPTSEMRREWQAEDNRHPLHPKPGKTYMSR